MKRRLCVFVTVSLICLAQCNRRPAEVIEIPDGYVGWVEIRYSSECGPAQQLSDGRRLLHVGTNGRLCVGSPWKEGDAVDEFYYVREGHRTPLREETPGTGMIWARSTRQVDLGRDRTDRFFVGTEYQFRAVANASP